jgi:high-affinity iron transporter
VFFNRTAIALIVIAAGVLAYGLGDLQDAGLLPGQRWIAFDLTPHIDPGSWWVSIVTGVTDLAPKMTVLQVTAWIAYLAVVIPAFVTAGRNPAIDDGGGPRHGSRSGGGHDDRGPPGRH